MNSPSPIANGKLQIKVHARVEGGRWLTAANAGRITARRTTPSDKMGNRLPSPIYRFRNDPPYYEVWKIKKEPKGYIFREVFHGGGICGCKPTVRELVISTLCGFSNNIVVEVDA